MLRSLLQHRRHHNPLSHQDDQLWDLIEHRLKHQGNSAKKRIIIVNSDPVAFLADFITASSLSYQVFLGNPQWGQLEWQQVMTLVQPHQVWGDCPILSDNSGMNRDHCPLKGDNLITASEGLIMIPTGGSSGTIRFAMHNLQTLTASVRGFQEYFAVDKVNSFCVLPLYHVSGLMQFLRSLLSGGHLFLATYGDLKQGNYLDLAPQRYFISLVPTQLKAILDHERLARWLSQFKTVLLGGAPSWVSLLEQARSQSIPLAPTYGMTETASQIATLKPKAFLSGMNHNGQLLPHAKIKILNEQGEALGINQVGLVTIQSESLFLGYYPYLYQNSSFFATDDLGYLDAQSNLQILGRKDHTIITGGEKVFPREVEEVIQATQRVKDVVVIGVKDEYWGQKVTAIYVPVSESITTEEMQTAIADKIARYKQPKQWLRVNNIPRNTQGKVNYLQLNRWIADLFL